MRGSPQLRLDPVTDKRRRLAGMWKNRFRVLLKRMECTIKNAIVIIGATQVLHNICMRHRDPYNLYTPDAEVRNLMKKYKQDMCPNCRP